jgi:hypothetical protein
MKPTGRANKPEQNLSNAIGGALTVSGLDLETKIFSASGRGRTFFLTSLFIELIDRVGKRRKLVRTLDGLYQRLENPRIFSSRLRSGGAATGGDGRGSAE